MADTFGQVWRAVKGHCPLASPLLCQYWVQQAYTGVCDKRPWSFLRAENEFLVNASHSGLVNMTRGSAVVTTTGITTGQMVFQTTSPTDQDRQFRVGTNQPVYTILAVDPVAQQITLDRVYGGTTSATNVGVQATILNAYLTVPSDFQRFLAVLDPANNWQLHLWVTDEEINTWDAQRSSVGTPWAVASRRLQTQGTFAGRIQFELWPFANTNKNYPYYYIRRPETLTDASTFLGPLAVEGNIMVNLALAEAAMWPGFEDRKNPYYDKALAQMKMKQAEDDLNRIEVLDEEIYMTWLETVSWINRLQFAPIDSRYLQSHDQHYTGFGGW